MFSPQFMYGLLIVAGLLSLGILFIKVTSQQGEVIILAPSRDGTFWKFENLVKMKFASVSPEENYDEVIWNLHQKVGRFPQTLPPNIWNIDSA